MFGLRSFDALLVQVIFFTLQTHVSKFKLFARALRLRLIPTRVLRQRHVDAIHGAGRYAQAATCTQIAEHHVHVFRCADDGIDGAGLNALGATDAVGFNDFGLMTGHFKAIGRVEGQDRARSDL